MSWILRLHGKHSFLWISRKDCILESRGWSHSIQSEIPHKECLGTHWREPQVTRAAWVSGRFLKILVFSLFFVNISKSPSPRDKRTVSLASSSNSTQENIIHQQNVSDFFYRSDWDSNQGSEKKSDAKIKPLGFIVSSPKWRMACLVRLVDGRAGGRWFKSRSSQAMLIGECSGGLRRLALAVRIFQVWIGRVMIFFLNGLNFPPLFRDIFYFNYYTHHTLLHTSHTVTHNLKFNMLVLSCLFGIGWQNVGWPPATMWVSHLAPGAK